MDHVNVANKLSLFDYIKNFGIIDSMYSVFLKDVVWSDVVFTILAGFVFGFLCGRHLSSILISFIVGFSMLAVLHYFGFVYVDWQGIRSVIGIGQFVTFEHYIYWCIELIKIHCVQVFFSFVGFFIGYKIG